MQATTPIDVDQLSRYLELHPDRVFVDTLIEGLRDGFDTGVSIVPTEIFVCPNNRSAINDPEFVTSALQSEVDQGFMIGPYDDPPFATYRISPIGVAVGKYSGKKRLIVDLSAPHDSPDTPSINELIPKEEFSLTYVTMDDAISILKQLGPLAFMNKLDISQAFKIIPIKPSLWHLYGVQWRGKYYFCSKLAFGSRSSPSLFDQLSRAICFIATNVFHIPHILHLLDDFWCADSPVDIPERSMAVLTHIFNKLKIPINTDKTMGPLQVLEFLGIILDSVKMEARLPFNKLERLRTVLSQFSCRRTCTKQELLSLLGYLSYACRVIVPGRSFMSYLIKLSTTVPGLFDKVYLTSECRADLAMWAHFVNTWNGVSMFLDDNLSSSDNLHLFTDASGIGFGGIFHNDWFQCKWPETFETKTNTAANMALLELIPIVVAAVVWGKQWARKKIVFQCDNMATVHIISKGRSKCSRIMPFMRRLTLCAATYHFTVRSVHLPGVTNRIADSLSRFDNTTFRTLAPNANVLPCPVPTMQELMF
jgi:hypothetical protein